MKVPDVDEVAIAEVESAVLRAGRDRPAVRAAIRAVKSAATVQFDEALRIQRAIFEQLRSSTEAESLRYLFFAERKIAKDAGVASREVIPINAIGVVGAGTLGVQIATSLLASGLDVVLVDRDQDSVDKGMRVLNELLEGLVKRGRMQASEQQRCLSGITPIADLCGVSDTQLVIEAVFEDLDTKLDVFRVLDLIAPGAILASNTSYLMLDDLAEATRRPQDVVGMHFFAPAHLMRVVEVARGVATSPRAMATALTLAARIDKLGLIVGATEGYVGNRVFAAYRRQCELMLEEGAYPEQIDRALEKFGLAMGPFAVADLSGLDIAWNMRKRRAIHRDSRERYVEIPDQLCEMGRLGQKTGRGWYDYPDGSRRGRSNPQVIRMIEEASAVKNIERHPFLAEDIVWRVLASMVNEAALVVADGTAHRATDVDVLAVHGYGFPRHRGGPVFEAMRPENRDTLGDAMTKLEAATGYGFVRGDIANLCPTEQPVRLSREGGRS